jgi:hypothetical protein
MHSKEKIRSGDPVHFPIAVPGGDDGLPEAGPRNTGGTNI